MRARAVGHRAVVLLACALGCATPAPAERAEERPADLVGEGRQLLARGDPRAACSVFEAARARDPSDARAYRGLAACHYLLRDYSRELEVRRQLLTIEPHSAPEWTNLGHLLVATDDLDGARTAYRRALELNPQDEPARFNLGLVEQELEWPGGRWPAPGYYEGDVPRYRDRRL